VIALIAIQDEGRILTVTENGYGKRTNVDEYPLHRRGGQGVISIQCSDRNGSVVGAVQVADDDQIMLITDAGTLVRTRVEEVSVLSRNTQGVTLINVGEQEKVIGIERIEILAESQEDENGAEE
jgi:DNA gyrase subunit A